MGRSSGCLPNLEVDSVQPALCNGGGKSRSNQHLRAGLHRWWPAGATPPRIQPNLRWWPAGAPPPAAPHGIASPSLTPPTKRKETPTILTPPTTLTSTLTPPSAIRQRTTSTSSSPPAASELTSQPPSTCSSPRTPGQHQLAIGRDSHHKHPLGSGDNNIHSLDVIQGRHKPPSGSPQASSGSTSLAKAHKAKSKAAAAKKKPPQRRKLRAGPGLATNAMRGMRLLPLQ